MKTASRVVTVHRMNCGKSCGPYGITTYDRQLYGLSLEDVLGEDLWDGAQVKVTVELLKQGSKIASRNPWLKEE